MALMLRFSTKKSDGSARPAFSRRVPSIVSAISESMPISLKSSILNSSSRSTSIPADMVCRITAEIAEDSEGEPGDERGDETDEAGVDRSSSSDDNSLLLVSIGDAGTSLLWLSNCFI